MTKQELNLALAVAQFTGFHYAAAGSDIGELCDAMGLTGKEWQAIKQDVEWLTEKEKADVDAHFYASEEAA